MVVRINLKLGEGLRPSRGSVVRINLTKSNLIIGLIISNTFSKMFGFPDSIVELGLIRALIPKENKFNNGLIRESLIPL